MSEFYNIMKTVFDYKISPDEWAKIRGMAKETYLSFVDPDTAKADIVTLFFLRGEIERATALSEELPPDVKNDLWRTLTHP